MSHIADYSSSFSSKRNDNTQRQGSPSSQQSGVTQEQIDLWNEIKNHAEDVPCVKWDPNKAYDEQTLVFKKCGEQEELGRVVNGNGEFYADVDGDGQTDDKVTIRSESNKFEMTIDLNDDGMNDYFVHHRRVAEGRFKTTIKINVDGDDTYDYQVKHSDASLGDSASTRTKIWVDSGGEDKDGKFSKKEKVFDGNKLDLEGYVNSDWSYVASDDQDVRILVRPDGTPLWDTNGNSITAEDLEKSGLSFITEDGIHNREDGHYFFHDQNGNIVKLVFNDNGRVERDDENNLKFEPVFLEIDEYGAPRLDTNGNYIFS